MKSILFLLPLWLGSTLSAGTVTYQANLGSLPTAQGFTLTDTTLSGPAPVVEFGILKQGQTPDSGTQYWFRDGLGADLGAGDVVELTARVRILSSGLLQAGPGAGFRTGFSIFVSDIAGNTFSLNLADGLAIFGGEYDAVLGATVSIPCDCFQWHTFRILAGGGAAQIWIDGLPFGSVPIVLNASSLSPLRDGFWFGDGTNFAGSRNQVEFITASTVVPEPATFGLVAFAALGWFVRRRVAGTAASTK